MGFTLVHQMSATLKPPNIHQRYRTSLVCLKCEEMVVATFDAPGPSIPGKSPLQCPIDPQEIGWALTNSYPKPVPASCPSHTPPELKRIFLQAANALKRGDPDASGAMSRKVVDNSSQQLLGDRSNKHNNIKGRIDALAAENILTPDLKNWAHEVRLGGNDAAHDLDPFTQEEAGELLDFAELYLTYVYTLPGRLKERRERAGQGKTANSS
jgi:hypothetical protein